MLHPDKRKEWTNWIIYGCVLFSLFYGNVSVSTYKSLYFTTDLNLPQAWYGYTEAIQRISTVVAILLIGWLSDSLGRKPFLVATLLLQSITQLLYVFLPARIPYFCILEFFNGISTANIVLLAIILIDRVPDINERAWYISKCTTLVFIAVFIASLSVIFIYDFKHEAVWFVASAINIVNSLLIVCVFPESIQFDRTEKQELIVVLRTLRKIDYLAFSVCFLHAMSFLSQILYISIFMKNELNLDDKEIGWVRAGQSILAIMLVFCYSKLNRLLSHENLMIAGLLIQASGAFATAIVVVHYKFTWAICALHICAFSFTSVVFVAIGTILSQRSDGLGVIMSINKTTETIAFAVSASVSAYIHELRFELPYYFGGVCSFTALIIILMLSMFYFRTPKLSTELFSSNQEV